MGAGKSARSASSKTGVPAIRNASRREEMLKLRIEGLTLQEIGERMGVAKNTVGTVISKALERQTREPSQQLISLELERCDVLWREAMRTATAYHPLVSGGNVVTGPVLTKDGQPVRDPETGEVQTCVLEDKAPKLAAITTAVRVMERRSKLLGLDAAVKLQQEVVIGDDGPSWNLSKLDSEELELFHHLLAKVSDPGTPAPAERRDEREELTHEEIEIMQTVFRKLDVKFLLADRVQAIAAFPRPRNIERTDK